MNEEDPVRGHAVTERQVETIEAMIRRGCLHIPTLAHESDLGGKTVLRVIMERFQARLQGEHEGRQLFELSDPHDLG